MARGGRWRSRDVDLPRALRDPLGTALPAMLGVHVMIGLGEAAITVEALSALTATRPDLIGGWAGAGTLLVFALGAGAVAAGRRRTGLAHHDPELLPASPHDR